MMSRVLRCCLLCSVLMVLSGAVSAQVKACDNSATVKDVRSILRENNAQRGSVPEPAPLMMMGMSIIGVVLARKIMLSKEAR